MIGGVHISFGGPDRIITDSAGRTRRFEDHPHLGPIVLNQRGDEHRAQPGSRSAFWPAWQAWMDQGKRLEADGLTCIWDKPEKQELVHLGGRNYEIAGSKLAQKFGKGRR